MTISDSSSAPVAAAPRSREPGSVPKDLRLEPLELRSRLDPQFLDEPVSSLLIRLESLRLTARAIEREHQLPARGLAERVLPHERLELTDDVAVATELEVGLDPFLEGDEAQLLQPPDLALRELLEGEVG